MTRVAIVGGGLAGLAAAVRLSDRGFCPDVFEARRQLGGRAGSFLDPATDDWIDHCQHVGMGCCTRLLELCARVGQGDFFRRDKTLHFLVPDGRHFPFQAVEWLPAPLHLAPAFWRLGYLTWRQRLAIARTLRRLVNLPATESLDRQSAESWLRGQGEGDDSLTRFWTVVLVSALSETLDQVSLAAARQVFVDGFCATRDAYHILVPRRPLGELSRAIGEWLRNRGVRVHCETPVDRVLGDARGVRGLEVAVAGESSRIQPYDAVLLAVPWHRVTSLLEPTLGDALPMWNSLREFHSAAITSLHLWWDRPLTDLPHAVLVDRLSQWVFRHSSESLPGCDTEHYYQVVISASHRHEANTAAATCAAVVEELRAVWPAARDAQLLRWRSLTQPRAVFSPRPGLESLRPDQRTPVPGLLLAGDWTRTGWPATMEGAIRSGEAAAKAIEIPVRK